ncbi:uncharacterized protein LOC143553415 [Bidens hawaiensis]|uniref:uncharacterized protein LOC143553415 n=1 Tax=Bidens hawaiensis TaxID=980011 RepID=UPI0040492096
MVIYGYPGMRGFRIKILDEARKSCYSIHSGATKMYQDLKKNYWWHAMKYEAEHQKPFGRLQPLKIPEWKWEHLTMDFVTKLPRTPRSNYDTIWATTEKLDKIKAFMKAAQDRKKSFADKRRRPLMFEAVDRVMLKVSPWKGIIRFRKQGKLSPIFIGPFRILSRVGEVAYRLDLPDELAGIRPTFHVSHLKKCLADEDAHVPLRNIELDSKLNYVEEPIAILDRQKKRKE